MPYKIDKLPAEVEAELQRRALAGATTVESVIVEILARHLAGASEDEATIRELAGSWVDDPAFDSAVAEFGRVDDEMWQ